MQNQIKMKIKISEKFRHWTSAMEQNRLSKEKVIPAQMCSCEYCKIFKDMFLKFNESAF